MIVLPGSGMAPSVNVHNVNLQILCDWIEGNVLFTEEEISTTDVVDILLENQIYQDQDFAAEFVSNAWVEIRRRFSMVSNDFMPLEQNDKRISRIRDWRESSGYSFCILLSFSKYYPTWARAFGQDFTEQGAIFEELSKESLVELLPKWEVHPTGWTKENPVTITDIVTDVADRLNETQGNLSRWANPKANELGLDLICHRPLPDNRPGRPVLLVQCASGNDWKDKLKTPDQELWNKIIDWASMPKKGFCMPFSLSEDDFTRSCVRVNGLLLDRYRLLSASKEKDDWISPDLSARIVAWMEPRVATLPLMV